jgi:hypothetical protein
MKWCLTVLSCESEGTAVPIDISLKNCLESAEIISQPKRWARPIEISVLPTPVGPIKTIRKFLIGIVFRRGLFFVLVQVINVFEIGKGFLILSIEEEIINFRNIFIIIIVIGNNDVII